MAARKSSKIATPPQIYDQQRPYLEWGAIMGGCAIAVAISTTLMQFGFAVGLSAGASMLESGAASWNVLVAGLWVIWVALASSSAGGYIAGRMRTRRIDASAHESDFRDGIHGLAVWAVTTIIAGFFLTLLTGLTATVSTTAEVSATVERFTGNTTAIFAFSTAAAAAISAGAAWWASTLGGEHRDEGIDVHALVPAAFRRR